MLKQTGLQSAGYRYLVLDGKRNVHTRHRSGRRSETADPEVSGLAPRADAWGEPERSQTGQLEGNKHRFPGGISKLAQSVHAKGGRFVPFAESSSIMIQQTKSRCHIHVAKADMIYSVASG